MGGDRKSEDFNVTQGHTEISNDIIRKMRQAHTDISDSILTRKRGCYSE